MELDVPRIRALLFDLDGTLIETDNQMVASWARPIGRVSRLWRDPDGVATARWLLMRAEGPGNTLVTLADRLGLDAPLASLSDRLHAWRGVSTPATATPVAGVLDMLRALRERYPLGLVTTRGRRAARELLAAAGLDGLFASVATREDTFFMKPNPAPVRLAAKQLGVAPENCLMTGDTVVDVRAGRRAGAQTAGVLCGFGERDELVRAGATLVLESTAQLGAALGAD